jgi:hypothetical protein
MEYIGQLIIFFAALVAIKGGTWNENKKGFKKITLTGYLTMLCAVVGLCVSIVITRQNSVERDSNKKIVLQTETNTEVAKQELQITRNQLEKANILIDSQNQKLAVSNALLQTYKEIIDQIKNQSDRQDQTVMIDFVDLQPSQTWQSPVCLYSGSIVEFFGFENDRNDDNGYNENRRYEGLYLNYGNKHEKINIWNGHAVTAIIGESGRGFIITLSNSSAGRIMGKIHVTSSPRIRSSEWSWIEEKLNHVSKKK